MVYFYLWFNRKYSEEFNHMHTSKLPDKEHTFYDLIFIKKSGAGYLLRDKIQEISKHMNSSSLRGNIRSFFPSSIN